MNLTPASFAPFGNEEAFLEFLGVNEIAHTVFADSLARTGYPVSSPPPIGNPIESPDWFADHWQRHKDECVTLRIPVPDLSAVDLSDEAQYYDWMLQHAQLHEQQNSALGITS